MATPADRSPPAFNGRQAIGVRNQGRGPSGAFRQAWMRIEGDMRGDNGTKTGTLPKNAFQEDFPRGDGLGDNPEGSGKPLRKARDFACRLKKAISSQNRYLPLLRRSSGAHLLC